MTNRQPQINIRVPQELKDKLHNAAKDHGISVNSEITTRLNESFSSLVIKEANLAPASQALEQSQSNTRTIYKYFRGKVIEEIDRRIKLGKNDAFIDFTELEIDTEDDPLIPTVIEPIIKELIDNGYTINDWDLGGVLVYWSNQN